MHNRLSRICEWCGMAFQGNRKYCGSECRSDALEGKTRDPTPDEIREMCCRIREEGGDAWERSRTCYAPQPFYLRVVSSSRLKKSMLEE